MGDRKPILCLDFDGVIHSYTSGWKGADKIPDPPVPGAIDFISDAINYFDVQIYSSRSNQDGGVRAMKKWLAKHWREHAQEPPVCFDSLVETAIGWPTAKPPAMVTLDDRALNFDGSWPAIDDLQNFKPWNKR